MQTLPLGTLFAILKQKGSEDMKADCHIHMVLDGMDWKKAIARHAQRPQEAYIRRVLERYREEGYTYLRDGGDRWGVGKLARTLAGDYGITYRTPLSPLCKKGHYGSFIGTAFESMGDFASLVAKTREQGGDFIKIMISGLMDFDRFGVLTEQGLAADEIREMIHIAHEEGMAVMAHANGARTVQAAAEAGVDSVEHGAYLDGEAMAAMEQAGTVWVPTLSTIGNLRGTGRFSEEDVERILNSALENLTVYKGLVAPGTDAGAWAVPHGVQTEQALLAQAGIGPERLERGIARIIEKF